LAPISIAHARRALPGHDVSLLPRILVHYTREGHLSYFVEGVAWQDDPPSESKEAYWRERRELQRCAMTPVQVDGVVSTTVNFDHPNQLLFLVIQPIGGQPIARALRRVDVAQDPVSDQGWDERFRGSIYEQGRTVGTAALVKDTH
jgi:hypothetical protein